MRHLIFILACLLPTLVCQARTITVDDDGSADFDTIQAAIDDANHGDVIVAKPGIYTGDGNHDIHFGSKAITVRSEKGPNVTVIDCENNDYGFGIRDNDVSEAHLEGFTIRNATYGAIRCYSSVLPRSAMASNATQTDVAILYNPGYAHVVIANCVITANHSIGIVCDGHDNVTITNCNISRNGGQGVYSYMSRPTIRNCLVAENDKTGIRATWPTIVNCTIVANQFDGVWARQANITNSIIWGNVGERIRDLNGNSVITYSDVQGGWKGRGNINADPLFADPNSSDYHLVPRSPCIGAGDPDYTPPPNEIDLDGNPRIMNSVIDIGAYEWQGPRILYVDADANGANDGSSWENAYNYLQDALASATYGDEIHIARGIYTPDRGVGFTAGDRLATFSLENGVALRGGYAGFAEPDPNSRDIEGYKTVLSGDLSGDDDVIDPCDLRFLYTPPTRIDNGYTVLTCATIDQTAILDGFTISSGHWAGISRLGGGRGAGMHNSASSPTLLDCTFTDNICSGYGSGGMDNINGSNPTLLRCTFETNYGCGMGNLGSNPELIDCKFIDNFSLSDRGGALYNAGSDPVLTRCIFSDNVRGAMYNYQSKPTLTECRFIRNRESVAIHNEASSATLVDCVFTENTVWDYASAIYSKSGQLTVEGCVFEKNYPRAIYDYSKTGSMFTNCTFTGNSALGYGGAIHTYNSTFTNCVFAGNRALGYRLNDGTWLPSTGGAVYYLNSYSMIFTNCTFINNWADFGHSIYCDGLTHLTNCILWGSGKQIVLDYPQWPPMVTMRYSDVQGNWPGEGNIDADPCFVDPGHWTNGNNPNQIVEPNDPNAVWIDGDYHLKSQAGRWDPNSQSWVKDDVTSPCIDAGNPTSPIGHEPFPNGGIINMGAYGGMAQASKSYFGERVCETIVAGDINGDCKVDYSDFALMAYHWLEDYRSR